MAGRISAEQLVEEWRELPKNWYAIYQWKRTTGASYAEEIASFVAESIDQIQLITNGLRQTGFRAPDHQGQADLQTDIAQFTEKRFCRAMFNLGQVPPLGRVVDYEVPLKATQGAPHGDIDLLCVNAETAFLVEAKKPSSESVLKATLEAFAYSSLVATVRSPFLACFSLPQNTTLSPAVLTFSNSQSGRQLADIETWPRLLDLIRALNRILCEAQISPLRFFVIQNHDRQAEDALTLEECPNGAKKVVFREGYVPGIHECAIH